MLLADDLLLTAVDQRLLARVIAVQQLGQMIAQAGHHDLPRPLFDAARRFCQDRNPEVRAAFAAELQRSDTLPGPLRRFVLRDDPLGRALNRTIAQPAPRAALITAAARDRPAAPAPARSRPAAPSPIVMDDAYDRIRATVAELQERGRLDDRLMIDLAENFGVWALVAIVAVRLALSDQAAARVVFDPALLERALTRMRASPYARAVLGDFARQQRQAS